MKTWPFIRMKGWTAVTLIFGLLACSSSGNKDTTKMGNDPDHFAEGTYGFDAAFLSQNGIETIELKDSLTGARVLIAPDYQGRVMTSTAGGNEGSSFGWINYDLIRSGTVSDQFNPVGGEERFWLGPEGGPFSIFFPEGKEQVFNNWKVPALIDTDAFEVVGRSDGGVTFSKESALTNASGTVFRLEIERTVTLLSLEAVSTLLDAEFPGKLKGVAYQSENIIRNRGSQAWTRDGGLLSIWMLSMFNPTEETTVFIPFEKGADGAIVNDDYFGKVPPERLIVGEGMIFFKIDGKYRSKIGIPYERARPLCGSYDSERKVLTLLWFNLPPDPRPYVNSKWGPQEDPYNGDAVNSYNDGPVEDGSIMGPFYEIETSSPGAALAPGESISHIQRTIHLQGEEHVLANVVKDLFGADLEEIINKFQRKK